MLKSSMQAIDPPDMEPFSSQADPDTGPESSAGGAFHWDVPGGAATILLDFNLVERLGFEIMRGFGAVPKRGAEVGGLLLGSAETGDRMVIRIEDFVAVPCEHLRGPSYVLSEKDQQAFDEALERWRPAPDKRIYAVGYFRSNTRELLQVSPEDLQLLESRFPAESAVFLQVKPYATRASEATIFLREKGSFPTESQPAAFPFRRKEMGGGKPSRRPRSNGSSGQDLNAAQEPDDETVEELSQEQAAGAVSVPSFGMAPLPPDSSSAPIPVTPAAKPRTGWFWIPLSFIFLLLGVVMGFQIALTFPGRQAASFSTDPYLLELSVVQFGESLHLKWNPDAAAFRTAKHGILHIRDGDNVKEVELKQDDLSRGGALYRHATTDVKFRLEVFPKDRNSVTESVELRMLDARN